MADDILTGKTRAGLRQAPEAHSLAKGDMIPVRKGEDWHLVSIDKLAQEIADRAQTKVDRAATTPVASSEERQEAATEDAAPLAPKRRARRTS